MRKIGELYTCCPKHDELKAVGSFLRFFVLFPVFTYFCPIMDRNDIVIDRAAQWLEAYAEGRLCDIPVSISKGTYISNLTPRGRTNVKTGDIMIFRDDPDVLPHELFHASDIMEHREWFSVRDGQALDAIKMGGSATREYAVRGMDASTMLPQDRTRLLACYFMSPVEMRAIAFSVFYCGDRWRVPYVDSIIELRNSIFDSGKFLGELSGIYTRDVIMGRYMAFMDFLQNPTRDGLKKLFEHIDGDSVFAEYRI